MATVLRFDLNEMSTSLENLSDDVNYRRIVDILDKVSQYLENEPYFFDKNKVFTIFLVKEVYPRIFNFIISTKRYQQLFFWISIYTRTCNFMALCRLFIFIPFTPTLFELIQSIKQIEDYAYYSFGFQAQTLIKFLIPNCNLNIYNKLLIDQLVQMQLIDVQIIPMLINDIPFRQSFSEISDYFKIFNYIFPYLNKTLLNEYTLEFSRFKFNINDKRFNSPTSIYLTKAMATCSPKFAPLHFDNLLNFIKLNNKQAKLEFVNLFKKSENLNELTERIEKNLETILINLRDEEEYLSEICSIILTNEVFPLQFFFEKIGSDLLYNLIYFDYGKERYTKEKITEIIDSEPFSDKMVEFGFKVIDYKIDLMPNASSFLRKSLFSPFFKEDMMNTIISISEKDSYRSILIDSINNYEIQNQNEYKIILQILILLKPKTEEFNYDNFVNEILNYTDSIFILPFLQSNKFIPIQNIDVEFLVSYSIFNQEFADFLFNIFSDSLINYSDFFLTFSIDDDNDNELNLNSSNKVYGRFLFDLFRKNNSNDSRLLWESIVRLKDEDDEVHQIAQKVINENPSKSQKEIIEKVENGYSRYFLNFDFSLFDEVSSEENGNFLVFNKPKLTSENSFYYYPSKIRYALNHSEKIEEEELLLLFEIRTNDSAIDAIILNTIFDAAMKLTIIFPFVEDSLILSLELRYQTFCEKLVKYIINSEGEVIDFNEGLLNSICNFDEKLLIDLIQNKKVPDDILYNFFSHFNTPHSSSVFAKINLEIPIQILNHIVYTKKDFVNFCKSNRIESNKIIPFIFSYNFPQFYRTKQLITSIFSWIKTSPNLLLDFLKSQKWKESKKESKLFISPKNFNPYVKSTKYFHVYLAIAQNISQFNYFKKAEISNFLANLLYSREGEEDSCLLPPINEMKNSIQNLRSEKGEINEYIISKFMDKIMRKLPRQILKQFEVSYLIKKSRYSLNFKFFNEMILKVNEKSVSKELENFSIFNNPRVLLFSIQQQKNFIIEKIININCKTYFLSSIVTHSNLYVPCKIHKNEDNGYSKWSNGEKVHVKSIKDEPIFIFYKQENEEGNETDYSNLIEKFKKIRTANYEFNNRAIICDSLNKAIDINWNEWKADQNLFEIATILLCQVGYSELFKSLSKNIEFSEYFFTSNWEEKFHINDINDELISLAQIFPRKDELLSILFKSVKEKNRQHFASIILSSFELNSEFVGKIITMISPSFESFEDVIINYFEKQTTTNELILQNKKLAEFVFKGIEKRYPQNSFTIFKHLLNPLTDDLFITCLKCFNKSSIESLLASLSKSTSRILLAMTELLHTNDIASVFCNVQPILKDIINDIDDGKSNIEEFRKDLKWIEFCLSSNNQKIRNHTYSIFKLIFHKSDSEILRPSFEASIIKSLFLPHFEEVKDFIETTSGVPFKKTSEFTTAIYKQLFERTYLHKNQSKIAQYIANLPPVPKSMIPRWKNIIDRSEGDFFVTMGSELMLAAIRCVYEPIPSYFQNIISEVAVRHDYSTIESMLKYFSLFINDENAHSYFRMIIEFEKWVPYYIHLINNIMINVKEFRESQLIILAIVLPNHVISQRACLNLGFNGFNSNGEIYISSLEIAINALEMVIDKKAFIRITKGQESDILTSRLYSHLIVKYFQVGLNFVFENYIGKNQYNFESIPQWGIQATKLYLKYMCLCSIVFPACTQLSLYFIDKNLALNLFGAAFQILQIDWSEFCCEISRQILADINFNTIQNKKLAVRAVNRELCTQLFHYNSAEKSFLRFINGVMKNDQLRTETKLKCNCQIFNVFRNDFVMYIDEIALFIDTSLDKYPEFFNDIEIKKFIFKLQINDHQIIQKLKIILSLFEKRQDKMKELIEDIFPAIEQLVNCEIELNDELSELLNSVFEQALVVYSS